jgi:nucleoside-diphosphate-sugar epimerase
VGSVGRFPHLHSLLLPAGYNVRTTVRSLTREPEVRATLKAADTPRSEAVAFVPTDLGADEGWAEAVAGCRYVLHVAPTFPPHVPKHEDDLIIPAREGVLRVLRPARYAGFERVVMTSSFSAVGYGHKPRTASFTEIDWTDMVVSTHSRY